MFNINFLHKESVNDDKFISVEGHPIRLIIGLGNPGEKYKNTYHNVGFMFLGSILNDKKGDDYGEAPKWKSVKNFRYIKLAMVTLVKPTSFMNKSGEQVKSALKYFNVPEKEILVVHDDADIAFGNHKISFGRGSAGHKGIESIIQALGTNEFLRVRIGIRTDSKKAGKFVLEKMTEGHRADLEKVFAEIQRKLFSSSA